MNEISKGQQLRLKGGRTVVVKERLGEGGQGTVYRVQEGTKEYALKYYTASQSKAFRMNLEENIRIGSPDERFLWPLAMTETDRSGRFGYLMELRPKEYKELSQFLLARVRFGSWSAIVHAALSVTKAFRELSRAGLSYQDLNDGNFFFRPDTGDVLICDNDNVTPPDTNLGILGKCRYMAPEVVTGQSKPNNLTDYYSLSVILFLILMANHPLEGKMVCALPCLNDEAERAIYGQKPVFIYDRKNPSNAPVQGVHSNVIRRWPIYPKFVREAFERAFSEEVLHNPNKRITCNEWLQILLRLRSVIVPCGCGNEFFWDMESSVTNCFNCGRAMTRPLILRGHAVQIPLAMGKTVYRGDVNGKNYFEALGTVIANKKNPSLWGLKNTSKETWQAEYKGQTRAIAPGETMPLTRGMAVTTENQTLKTE